MATQPPSENGRRVPVTIVQQSILQQAEAVVPAQTNPSSPRRQEALLQETDLITPDVGEDDMPPPAYGVNYETRNEKDGLGTSGRVTDDCRVDIRINQFNRHLSQIFTPDLRQQVQNAQHSRPPPPPYIPPSLGGEEGVPPPPPLNVVIQVVGSRGDVQPFVALGKVLKTNYGHRVRLATHPNFKDFVREHGLEFFNIGGDPSQLMAFMVKNPSLVPGFRTLLKGDVNQRRRDVAEYIQGCWRSCYQAGDGMSLCAIDNDQSEPAARPFVADCIIANPPSFAHIHCAEKLGIPLHIMFTMPYSPTQAFPHPLANIQSSNADPQVTNYISYTMIELLLWQGIGDIINRFRAKCLGLDPVSLIWAPGMLHRLKVPHTYCWSPALLPKPKDWGPHISTSGFYFLNSASDYTPAPDLQAFLDAGLPPIYIGFGSIILADPNAMTELIFDSVRKTGQRILLSKGWGGMGADELCIPDGVFMLGNVPHDWLFNHVSCVVHHGGAGTTAAGIAAGRPTLVVPFFGDQPFWGAMVSRAGAGPDPIPYRQLTADKLADAINTLLKPESLERAKELASKIAAERGSDMGAQSFHQYLEIDRLRCTLAPSRAAAWRVKRTQVKLSAFAACTLANSDLLDFRDLKLFRPQEYYTDDGPWDPISGGFTAFLGAVGGMMVGLADVPSETWRALQIPASRNRQLSQASVPTIANKGETSNIAERLSPSTSRDQSQSSLNIQEALSHARSRPNLSSRSATPTSNVGSNFVPGSLQSQLDPKPDSEGQIQFCNRNESGPREDTDMLRPTGVHMSRGAGRFVKALVQGPVDISVNLTRGCHNIPKLWGDDTVRPQERVSDLKSGVKAVGREFGFGWYDGITGLVTQPWKGAQKEGASGFVKGVGKGIGGFLAKPGAACLGILSHTMQGVSKEVQKFFGSNVQNYIIASRAAQGYEEWLQSSDEEKQDVILRWKLVQKYLKKKRYADDMVHDVLDAQRKENIGDTEARQNYGHAVRSAQSASANIPALGHGGILATGGSQCPEIPLIVAEINETNRLSVQETSFGNAEEDADMEQAIQEGVSQIQRRRQEATDHQADQENKRQAMVASVAEAQRHQSEALKYEKMVMQVMAQNLWAQRQSGSDSEWESDTGLDEEDKGSKNIAEKAATVASRSPSVRRPHSFNPGHLAGTTRSEFESQQQGRQRERTAQERTEEEIVIEYIKKQSLLEVHHQNKGKHRATAIDDEDDEDVQVALRLSMQEHGDRYGEASGI